MKVRIISIDGGGVRGIVPAIVLQYIENKIIELVNDPDARISDFVDFVAGTSTGSIITSMMLTPDKNRRPIYKMEDIVNAYFELADVVFKKHFWRNVKTLWGILGPKYSPENIDKQLIKKLDHWRMIELLKPCAITGYDIKTRKPTIFTNRDDKLKYGNYFVKDIVRGSTSIPAFFEPSYFRNGVNINTVIDGGVFANNPSMIAYIEVLKTKEIKNKFNHKIDPTDILFLSFGTGETELKTYNFRTVKRWGMLKWFMPILNILLQSVREVTNHEMYMLFDTYNASENYHRINPEIIHGSSSGEDGSETNMKRLKQDALNYIISNKDYLDNLAKELINNGTKYKYTKLLK